MLWENGGTMIFTETGDIKVHQSWLDDAMRCGERGRLGIVKPEWDGPSDATTLGTGTHAACEYKLACDLDGTHFTLSDARDKIVEAIDYELSLPNLRWNKYDDRNELVRRARACFDVWLKDIYPVLPKGGFPEAKFDVPIFYLDDGRCVSIEGSIDYVPPSHNELWDWKFPGRTYQQKAKQKHGIQPTIYTLAAVMGGLESFTPFEFTYPMMFRYGIGVTQVNQAKAQMFDVSRTTAHANFAISRIRQYVNLALNFGLDQPWPTNDDHFLCSDRWCPWWKICKGAHLTWQDDIVVPDQSVDLQA